MAPPKSICNHALERDRVTSRASHQLSGSTPGHFPTDRLVGFQEKEGSCAAKVVDGERGLTPDWRQPAAKESLVI
jgi:hypothetical protein